MEEFRFGQSAMFEMGAEWRIESVERVLDYLEDFLPHAKNQAFLQKKRELESNAEGVDREEIEAELELMELEWGSRIPAYFYGSLFVLLWGETEAVIKCFTDEVKSIKGITLDFGDISGSSSYSRLRKYVEAVLGVSLRENSAIEDLQFLRNLFAHHGGDTSLQSKRKTKRIDAITRARPGVTKLDIFLLARKCYVFA